MLQIVLYLKYGLFENRGIHHAWIYRKKKDMECKDELLKEYITIDSEISFQVNFMEHHKVIKKYIAIKRTQKMVRDIESNWQGLAQWSSD